MYYVQCVVAYWNETGAERNGTGWNGMEGRGAKCNAMHCNVVYLCIKRNVLYRDLMYCHVFAWYTWICKLYLATFNLFSSNLLLILSFYGFVNTEP